MMATSVVLPAGGLFSYDCSMPGLTNKSPFTVKIENYYARGVALMHLRYWKTLAALLGGLLLTACSAMHTNTLPPTLTGQTPTCLPALTQLDALAAKHSGTLSDQRIANTPWLRNNRFLHSFQQQTLNRAQLSALMQRMNRRAIHGLGNESRHIPATALKHWQKTHRIQTTPAAFIQRCSTTLLRAQLAKPMAARTWLNQLNVPDSYSTLQRVLGFYPLAAIPFRWGVANEQHELQEQWGQIQGKPWTSYPPNRANSTLSTASVKPPKDALQIPVLNAQTTQRLFTRHAPTWLIDSGSEVNRPGTPYLQQNKVEVDTKRYTTYTYLSHGRWRDQITTQLNYIVWFSERPMLSTFDWVAGKHDAVIFRVHLDAAQNILAYDSIHLCGCWYRLFLPEGTEFQDRKAYDREPVIAEYTTAARQMQVYISRDTHQITALRPVGNKPNKPADTRTYQLQPFSQLLHLPAFNQQGYVPDSERPERWFFWPMGVKNPGAVRRFGEHAISFIGKRHFDDPYLLREVGVY